MAPVRVQLKRTKGWRMPENTVKVDRTTKWGNPFRLEEPNGLGRLLGMRLGCWTVYPHNITGTELIRLMIAADCPVGSACTEEFWDKADALQASVKKFRKIVAPNLPVEELRGKNLACWCALDKPCHGDVLLELANPSPQLRGR